MVLVVLILTTFPVGTGLLQGCFQRGLVGCCVNAACMKLPQHLKLYCRQKNLYLCWIVRMMKMDT